MNGLRWSRVLTDDSPQNALKYPGSQATRNAVLPPTPWRRAAKHTTGTPVSIQLNEQVGSLTQEILDTLKSIKLVPYTKDGSLMARC